MGDSKTYDLHITVNPDTLDRSLIKDPWQIHDIHNVQGIPHLIISLKYTGIIPMGILDYMVEKLKANGVEIYREKIELHFKTIDELGAFKGIIEVHYKLRRVGIFSVTDEQVKELTNKKLAFSFNKDPQRRIVSVRFANLEAYVKGRAGDVLPDYLDEEERELVIFDTNNELDSFWPMRTEEDLPLSFNHLPNWITQ